MQARRGKSASSRRGAARSGAGSRPPSKSRPAKSGIKGTSARGKTSRGKKGPKPAARTPSRSAPRSPGRPARKTRPPVPRRSYAGGCHCGAIEFTFETALEPRRWAVQSCQCSFCRGHGARTTADPAGLVQFDFKLPEFLRRYRFGLRTGDFLVCRECGTYVAAVLLTGRGALANINVNTLREPPRAIPPGKPVEPELETGEHRRLARSRSWTPVMGPV